MTKKSDLRPDARRLGGAAAERKNAGLSPRFCCVNLGFGETHLREL